MVLSLAGIFGCGNYIIPLGKACGSFYLLFKPQNFGRTKKINALLILLISSLAITGISFIDGKVWDLIFLITGMVAYAIVGLLFSVGVLHGKQDGKDAYAWVFFLLILGGYAAYRGLVRLKIWLLGLPLFVKILVPSVIAVAIVLIIVYKIIKRKRPKESPQKGVQD